MLTLACVAVIAPGAAWAADADAEIEGVIVTATKRPERVREISGSVSAVTAADIDALGASAWSEYLNRVPGVVLNDSIPGWSFVTIRGVSSTTASEQGQTTTGYYINDIPLTDPTYSIGNPDIDTFDVDNVSILRGPQATLYGAAALGGTVNYQAARPDFGGYAARLFTSASDTRYGAESGAAKAMINVPLVEGVLAARLTAVYRKDGGYIDNVGVNDPDSNSTVTKGGRLQLSWRPGEHTRIDYMLLYQDQLTDDMGYQEARAGVLRKATKISEPQHFNIALNSLRLDQDTPLGDLTALVAYSRKTQRIVTDATPYFAGLAAGVPYYVNTQVGKSRGYMGEVRLASPSGRRLEYLVGGYYRNSTNPLDEPFTGPGVTSGVNTQWGPVFGAGIGSRTSPNDRLFQGSFRFEAEEAAVFGEATYHLNDQWKVTAGGRYFDNTVRNISITSYFLNFLLRRTQDTVLNGVEKSKDFLPKASITWTRDRDFMAYALVSKGFRLGGVNLQLARPGVQVPPATYAPDSLINYELGFRSNWLDRKVQVDGTFFLIDWSDVQLPFSVPGVGRFQTNAGKARSKGFEGVVQWVPMANLTLASNVTYLDARLSNPFDPGNNQPIVPKDARLPGASKWQLSNSVSYRWADVPYEPSLTVFHRYISGAPGQFNQAGTQQGAYHKVDARLSLRKNDVEVSLFANNVFDSRGVTTAFAGSLPLGQYIVRPRTVGVSLDVKM